MTPWPFAGSSWKEPDRPSTPTTGSLPIGHGLASAGGAVGGVRPARVDPLPAGSRPDSGFGSGFDGRTTGHEPLPAKPDISPDPLEAGFPRSLVNPESPKIHG